MRLCSAATLRRQGAPGQMTWLKNPPRLAYFFLFPSYLVFSFYALKGVLSASAQNLGTPLGS